VSLRYEREEARDDGPPLSSFQPRDEFVSYYRREHGVEDVPENLMGAFNEVLEVGHDG
jgi:hypothetical protein